MAEALSAVGSFFAANAGTIASVAGSAGSLYFSGQAADAEQGGFQQAAALQEGQLAQNREFFSTGLELLRPNVQVGQQALNSLAVLYGLEPAVPSGVTAEQAIAAAQQREIAEQTGQPIQEVRAQQEAQAAEQRTVDAAQQPVTLDARLRDKDGNIVRYNPVTGEFIGGNDVVVATAQEGQLDGLIYGNNSPVEIRDGQLVAIGNSGGVFEIGGLPSGQGGPTLLNRVKGPNGSAVYVDAARGLFVDAQGNSLGEIKEGTVPGLINDKDNPVAVRADGVIVGVGSSGVNELLRLDTIRQEPGIAGVGAAPSGTAPSGAASSGTVPGGAANPLAGDVNGQQLPTSGSPPPAGTALADAPPPADLAAAQAGIDPSSGVAGTNALANAATTGTVANTGAAGVALNDIGFNDPVNSPPPTQEGVLGALGEFPVSTFLQTEGMRNIQGSAAAGGSLQSGRTLKALVEYNQNLANAQSIQPFISGLQALAGVGQSAAGNSQNVITNAQTANQSGTNNLANLALAGGQSRASAFANQNNALQGGLSNLVTAATANQRD